MFVKNKKKLMDVRVQCTNISYGKGTRISWIRLRNTFARQSDYFKLATASFFFYEL